MKASISRDLPLAALLSSLSPPLRKRAISIVKGDGPFTLIVFRGRVVLSSAVRRALARLNRSELRIVAAADNFTEEAQDLLRECAADVVTLGDFHWTDESSTTL